MNPVVRLAGASDVDALVDMRAVMFADMGMEAPESDWRSAARAWFAQALDQPTLCLVVVDEHGLPVSCGMIELHAGVPGPTCPTGRTAHVSNLVTRRDFRRRGFGSLILNYLLEWASGKADRVELHASAQGLATYRRLGFEVAPNPAMRLNLPAVPGPAAQD